MQLIKELDDVNIYIYSLTYSRHAYMFFFSVKLKMLKIKHRRPPYRHHQLKHHQRRHKMAFPQHRSHRQQLIGLSQPHIGQRHRHVTTSTTRIEVIN